MAKRGKSGPALPDWHLWTEVAKSVTPLRAQKPEPSAGDEPLPLPAPVNPEVSIPKAWRVGENVARAPAAPPAPRSGTTPWLSNKPIEPRLRRKLMRGQVEIDGTIDLHGMRQDEARAALIRFITARSARGERTVLVITGKGLKKMGDDAAIIIERGVLRSMLPLWLSQPDLRPLVAGWNAASQGHGGEGAFYVRLKRVRP